MNAARLLGYFRGAPNQGLQCHAGWWVIFNVEQKAGVNRIIHLLLTSGLLGRHFVILPEPKKSADETSPAHGMSIVVY